MFKKSLLALCTVLSLGLITACSSTPYTPAATQTQAIDLDAYAPKVDSFVVLLDVSSSMKDDYQDRPKMHIAQDLVASFNSTVPPVKFDAGLVTFGKGTGRCIGQGTASTDYGMTNHQAADFASALGSIACAGGTTPMSDGVDATTTALAGQSGDIAVVIVSDFQWLDANAVRASVAQLKAQHGDKVCIHTVKVGDNTSGDALISEITNVAGCDSATTAEDLASAGSMANYVTATLLAPLVYEKHSVSATALFDFDKAVLKDQGKAELQNLADAINSKGVSIIDIDVIGHTDSMGAEDYNQALSERRAMAVKDYVVSKGVDASIIDVSGKGESEPAASNDTEEGRALNRRVEIHVGTSQRAAN
ncbi:MAG: OmpA family protein [Gammaproteobacteria bacterium]|nr:OmpA family protein [Gammaproteobacteria bacterium]